MSEIEARRLKAEEVGHEKLILNLGPQHPSTHGVLRVITTLEGERITEAEPDIGFLHRNFEKIVEGWTWSQVIPLTDRNDYLANINNEHAYVLAVEKLAGIEVPERAEYIRVIMSELNRIASHLLTFGTFAMDMGAFTPFLYGFRERELLYDIFEKVTGARMMHNYVRLSGVRNDLPDGWDKEVLEFLDRLENDVIPDYYDLLIKNPIFEARSLGVGVLTKEDAIAYGAAGPILRGSGIDWDLRRDMPYSIYDRFDFEVITREEGDHYARFMVRMDEMIESAKIIRQAFEQMPEGPVMGKVPRVLKPEGDIYSAVEGPRGEIGVYLVGDGNFKPYRVKWRAPSFSNLSILPLMAKGQFVADIVLTIGTLDPIFGEVDR